MNPDIHKLIGDEVLLIRATLTQLIERMLDNETALETLEQALLLVQTLASLCAVNSLPHVAQYAAQMEQLVLNLKNTTPEGQPIPNPVKKAFLSVEKAFMQECELLS